MPKVKDSTHKYHAETTVLSGQLVLPVAQKIEPQAHTKLPENGGYFSQRQDIFRLESVVSFRSAYSHVTGSKSNKPDEGWNTLTTTVVEGLNVMEVLPRRPYAVDLLPRHAL
jgi:hypothetical protein